MADVAHADKEQQGAFVRDERVLVAWSDHIDGIVPLCKDFEQKLISRVWRMRPSMTTFGTSGTLTAAQSSAASTVSGSADGLNEKSAFDQEEPEKKEEPAHVPARDMPKPKSKWSFFRSKGAPAAPAASEDLENAKAKRPMRLFAPAYGGLACALSLCKFSSSLRCESI
jgi:hypothetical protein